MSIFKQLHAELEIPENYHIETRYTKAPPPISASHRASAIQRLKDAGEIGGDTVDNLLHAAMDRLGKLRDMKGPPIRTYTGGKRLTPQMQLTKSIRDANPGASIEEIAELSGKHPETIRNHLRWLKKLDG